MKYKKPGSIKEPMTKKGTLRRPAYIGLTVLVEYAIPQMADDYREHQREWNSKWTALNKVHDAGVRAAQERAGMACRNEPEYQDYDKAITRHRKCQRLAFYALCAKWAARRIAP